MLRHSILIVLVFTLMIGHHTLAVSISDLPAATSWVLSIDLKSATQSSLLQYIADNIDTDRRKQATAQLDAIKGMFGVHLLDDIEYLVLAGQGQIEAGGTAYVYGNFDAERLVTLFPALEKYNTTKHNNVTVHSWIDKGDQKQKFIAFARPGMAVLANKQSIINNALDVIAGTQPQLGSNSPFAPAFKRSKDNIATLLATGVSSLAGNDPKVAMLKQANGIVLRLRELDNNTLNLDLLAETESEDSAAQIHQALLGIQAISLLQGSENAQSETAMLATLAKVSREGKRIGIALNLPQDAIRQLLELSKKKQ